MLQEIIFWADGEWECPHPCSNSLRTLHWWGVQGNGNIISWLKITSSFRACGLSNTLFTLQSKCWQQQVDGKVQAERWSPRASYSNPDDAGEDSAICNLQCSKISMLASEQDRFHKRHKCSRQQTKSRSICSGREASRRHAREWFRVQALESGRAVWSSALLLPAMSSWACHQFFCVLSFVHCINWDKKVRCGA